MHNLKVVQWRVRDLASCFHSCHFSPLEKEADISYGRPQGSKGSKVFDLRSGGHKGAGRVPTRAKDMCRGDSEADAPSKTTVRAAEGESTFSEEDYIVFCFRQDGGIHLVESKACHENDRVNTAIASGPIKDHEKCSSKMDTKWPSNEEETKDDIKKQPNANKVDHPSESSDSNQSETSTRSSFAFPELGVEWTGSPVHMPQAEKHEHTSQIASLYTVTDYK